MESFKELQRKCREYRLDPCEGKGITIDTLREKIRIYEEAVVEEPEEELIPIEGIPSLPAARAHAIPPHLRVSSTYEPSYLLPQRELSSYGKKGRTLGSGSFGEVAVYGDKYAVKTMEIEESDEGISEATIREISILLRCNHPNVVPLYDVIREEEQIYHLVLPLALSDLETALLTFDEEERERASYQIICGLTYLHANDIIHRDLKPQNILHYGGGNVQISDFGLALGVGCPFPTGLTNEVYTLWYRSPEIASDEDYTTAADIWALGCVLYELWGKQGPLFRGVTDDANLLRVIFATERSGSVEYNLNRTGVNGDVIYLILRCLDIAPEQRATAQQLVESALFDLIRVKENEEYSAPCEIALARRESYPERPRPFEKDWILFGWLHDSRKALKLPPRTYHHAIWLYDAINTASGELPSNQMQLYAAAALSLASKYSGEGVPINNFTYMAAGAFIDEQLVEAENSILREVNYDVVQTLTYDFLRLETEGKDEYADILLVLLTFHPLRFTLMPRELASLALSLAKIAEGKEVTLSATESGEMARFLPSIKRQLPITANKEVVLQILNRIEAAIFIR